MEKQSLKTFFLYWTFFVIIGINVYISLFNSLEISFSFVILIIGSLIYYVMFPLSIYKLVTTFTLMVWYVALLMWEKITPVWYIVSSTILIPFFISFIIILLVKPLLEQLAIVLVGLSIGQLVFGFILISYQLHHVLAEIHFFIYLYISILFIIVFHFLQDILLQMKQRSGQKV